MKLKTRGKEVYTTAKAEMKKMNIWREDKEVLLKMYAQSVDDWENAVDEAAQNGEVSTTHNGTEQINAWHTKKNKYASQSKALYERLFHASELKEVKKGNEGKETTKGITDLLK